MHIGELSQVEAKGLDFLLVHQLVIGRRSEGCYNFLGVFIESVPIGTSHFLKGWPVAVGC